MQIIARSKLKTVCALKKAHGFDLPAEQSKLSSLWTVQTTSPRGTCHEEQDLTSPNNKRNTKNQIQSAQQRPRCKAQQASHTARQRGSAAVRDQHMSAAHLYPLDGLQWPQLDCTSANVAWSEQPVCLQLAMGFKHDVPVTTHFFMNGQQCASSPLHCSVFRQSPQRSTLSGFVHPDACTQGSGAQAPQVAGHLSLTVSLEH